MSNIKIGWGEVSLVPEGRKVNLSGQFYERITDAVETPKKLRTDWKWRLFVIRATLDRELLNNGYITRYSETAQAAYSELYKITHTENAKFCVHPPKGL